MGKKEIAFITIGIAVFATDYFWYKPGVAAEEAKQKEIDTYCLETIKEVIQTGKNYLDEFQPGGRMAGCENTRLPPYG